MPRGDERLTKVGKAAIGKTFLYKGKTYRIVKFPDTKTISGTCITSGSLGDKIIVELSKISKIRPTS